MHKPICWRCSFLCTGVNFTVKDHYFRRKNDIDDSNKNEVTVKPSS